MLHRLFRPLPVVKQVIDLLDGDADEWRPVGAACIPEHVFPAMIDSILNEVA